MNSWESEGTNIVLVAAASPCAVCGEHVVRGLSQACATRDLSTVGESLRMKKMSLQACAGSSWKRRCTCGIDPPSIAARNGRRSRVFEDQAKKRALTAELGMRSLPGGGGIS
jgi:hypothetical protein